MLALRFLACSRSSNIIAPAPSDKTNPSLSISHGLLAVIGLFEVDNALAAINPEIAKGVLAISLPPATITSDSPYAIDLAAEPIQWFPDEQAVTVLTFEPLNPNFIEI